MSSIPTQLNFGYFLPTTSVWDVTPLYGSELTPEATRELFVRMYQNTNQIALAVNAKDTGIYALEEFLPGKQWFPNPDDERNRSQSSIFRQVFRKTFNIGILTVAGVNTHLHGIDIANQNVTFTDIYGTANDVINNNYFPLPYVDPVAANNITLRVDGTNIIIDTIAVNRNTFTAYVVLEYIQE